ncbi:hypothetical protein JCM5296_001773 [Sporobolomyces johnsonii]
MSISNAQASVSFLSGADDLRLLLDFSIFNEPKINGRATGKMNKHNRELRMHDSEVVDAKALVTQLRKGTITVTAGLDALLALPSVRAFNKKWDDEPLFANHAKRYVLAFRPECGIAFHETDRYKNPAGLKGAKAKKNLSAIAARRDPSTFIEVGVFATRSFKKGEVINLRGGIADLTEEEDDELRDSGGRSDFSVLWSERKNCFCLLLGPARFVNHDCRNNVEFQLVGSNMTFKVLEDIEKDEEIFTHYGAHYFEMDNASCLCATCEQLKQGAFAPASSRAKKATPASPQPDTPPSRSRRASSPGPGPRRSSARTSLLPPPNYNENARPEPVASGSGHTLTAQRSLSRTGPGSLARSSSLSSLASRASSVRSRPPPSRINPTRGSPSVVDTLRAQPRIVVQPKLPPPPGYAMDYTWDAKKKVARYIGPLFSSCDEDKRKKQKGSAALSRSASAPSVVSLGKRRRAETDSPQPRGTARTLAKSTSSPAPTKKPRSTLVQLKKVRVGERSSGRLRAGKGTASARDRNFAKLNEALGQDGDSSDLSDGAEEEVDEESELSEAEESEAEKAEEAEEAEEEAPMTRHKAKLDKGKGKAVEEADDIEMKGVESTASPTPAPSKSASPSLPSAMPTTRSLRSRTSTATAHLRAITLDIGSSTSTPAEESLSPQLRQASVAEGSEEEQDQIVLCPTPGSAKKSDDPVPSKKPRQPISAPNFYSSAADSSSSNSNSNQNPSDGRGTSADRSANNNHEGPSFWVARGDEGGGRARRDPAGIGGSGGGGDDPGDERGGGGRRVEPEDKMDFEEEEEKKPEREEMEAAVQESGESADAAEDPQDAAAALLMLLAAPPSACTPSSTAPTPPSATSTDAGTEASSSAFQLGPPIQLDSAAGSSRKGKRASRLSDGQDPLPASNPRSTRRQPKLEESPAASTSAPAPRAKRARSAASNSPAAPSSSNARSNIRRRSSRLPVEDAPREEGAQTATPPPSQDGRRTRSQPIPGRLEDVLSAPETLAATGGFDYAKGKYITKHEQLRSPSADPRPHRPSLSASFSAPPPSVSRIPRSPVASSSKTRRLSHSPATAAPVASRPTAAASSSAPPEGVRATRRSFPIAEKLRDIIYSSSALAATGGFDFEKGKYVGASSSTLASTSASPAPAQPSSRDSSTSAAKPSSSKRAPSASASASPRPASPASGASPAPPEGVRATRRSFPINQPIQQLIYSPAATSVAGGWDPASGKYISTSRARKAAAGEQGAAEASTNGSGAE